MQEEIQTKPPTALNLGRFRVCPVNGSVFGRIREVKTISVMRLSTLL
jgi:hypothetical protein